MLKAQHSAVGRIKKLFMVYNGMKDSLDLIVEMAKKLEDHTTLIVWLNDVKLKVDIKDRLKNESVNIDYCNPKTPMNVSMWVRDGFIIRSDNSRNNELITMSNDPDDKICFNLLTKSCNQHVTNKISCELLSNGNLKAGNFIIGDDYVLVDLSDFGARVNIDILKDQIKQCLFPDPKVPSRIYFYCTLTKCFPAFNNPINRSKFLRFQGASPFVHGDQFLTHTGIKIGKRDLVFLARTVALSPKLRFYQSNNNQFLDDIHDLLIKTGRFFVLRNTIPLIPVDKNELSREYYIGMYNNCLVEYIDEENRNVYLPSYLYDASPDFNVEQLKQIENENIALWDEFEFKVNLIENVSFKSFSRKRGAIHCLTNELLRT